jgi:hypothetical protein
MQESNVRSCQPFGSIVLFCRSRGVTTIDVVSICNMKILFPWDVDVLCIESYQFTRVNNKTQLKETRRQ